MENAFDILGLPRKFDLSGAEIAAAYRRAILQAHPDLETDSDSEAAAKLNFAKRTLEHPLRRAEHLCDIVHGATIGREPALPGDFLMEMMEIRETAESEISAQGDSARTTWRSWADRRRNSAIQEMAAAFQSGADQHSIRALLSRWRYLERMIEQLDPNYDVRSS